MIDALRGLVREGRARCLAWVVNPDHLHMVVVLHEDWPGPFMQSLKLRISRHPNVRSITPTIWQRRFYEHVCRDAIDLHRHLDYIHYNPVKHGLVRASGDWPWSSFRRFVAKGHYAPDWGCGGEPKAVSGMDLD